MKNTYLKTIPLILFVTCFFGCDEGENHWRRVLREDLAFMRAQILENHPGPLNVEDPQFTKELERAYHDALSHAEQVGTRDDYARVVKMFADSFHDTHVRVIEKKKKTSQDKKQKPAVCAFDEVAPQIAWIRLPTFDPDDTQREQLLGIFRMLKHINNYRAIVFDIHGNTGGNTEWARNIVEGLFSPRYMQQRQYAIWQAIDIDYRVSSDNLDHLKGIARACAKDFGQESELARGYADFSQTMSEALERGEAFVRVSKGTYQPPVKGIPNPVHAPIIVIIDRKCVSACLDFIDLLKNMQHPVILFGETTDSDTFYMDVRRVKLPSAYGLFQFPIKVLRGRLRGNNQPYRPDVPYAGDLDDTPRVAEAVYKLILTLKKS